LPISVHSYSLDLAYVAAFESPGQALPDRRSLQVRGDLGKAALLVPIEGAGPAADIDYVAVLAARRHKVLVSPVTGCPAVPDRAKILSKEVAYALLKTGAGQHLPIGCDRE
jgi:hypothetical protein